MVSLATRPVRWSLVPCLPAPQAPCLSALAIALCYTQTLQSSSQFSNSMSLTASNIARGYNPTLHMILQINVCCGLKARFISFARDMTSSYLKVSFFKYVKYRNAHKLWSLKKLFLIVGRYFSQPKKSCISPSLFKFLILTGNFDWKVHHSMTTEQ